MEDLWKDITLSTLSSIHHPSPAQPRHQHHRHHLRSSSGSGSSLACTTIFQDFLARPFSLDHHHHRTTNILPSPSPSPTPQTLLSLNTDHPPHLHQHSPHHHHSSFDINNNTCASSSSVHHFGKRLLQQETESHQMNLGSQQCPSGRRHQRMIKNRESAARSRARKQAYTSELELEVAQLKQENARLRMEQEMLNQAATVDESPKKHKKLHRTSTAPF